MKRVLGIIFSNMHEHSVSELTANRCMGSIPVGGRYRLIDFTLSNMTNSGIEHVGVITKSNYQSLMDHLGSGRSWDLARKHGGLVILPPFGRAETGMYRGRVEALAGIMGFVKNSGAKQVLMADCDILANMDLAGLVQAHRESGAKITMMYKRMNLADDCGKERSALTLGEDGRVRDILVNPTAVGEQNIYLNIMVADREYLEHMVGHCYSRNELSFEQGVLQECMAQGEVASYPFEGYVSRFNSMRSYFEANMELLAREVREALFPRRRPIFTKVRDEAPVRYGLENHVTGSLLADGCLIEGEVENSVLFRGVTVEKGAKVKNCILMQGTHVGAGSNVEYIISDKDVTIKESRMIMGFETYPVYISKGSVV